MGFMDWLSRSVPDPTPRSFALQSPRATNVFDPNIVIADVFGVDAPNIVTREMAMQVPAVAKARHLICSTISSADWSAYKGDAKMPNQPLWITQTSTSVPVALRWMWTVDDLIFYGWSLWAVQRGSNNTILDAVRIPRTRWDFDAVGRVVLDGELVDDKAVILFPGPFEGLLVAGANLITAALNMERAWQARVRNPAAMTELHNTDANDPLTPDEAKAMVADYNTKRRSLDGSVTYTPANIQIIEHGVGGSDLFINGRNAVTIDVARMLGLPANQLDASQVAASLTYATTESGRLDLIDSISNMWADPIKDRLSMDDVLPHGTVIDVDFTPSITYRNAIQVTAPGSQTEAQVQQQQTPQEIPNVAQ